MTRPRRILSIVGLVLTGLLLLAMTITYVAVQTNWFREFVRQKIIVATQDATGGEVEVASFAFDVTGLRAVVTSFVIHGKEPSGASPFLSASRVEVAFRLFTSIRHLLDITYLGVQDPRMNVLIFDDGTTNIPIPKEKKRSDATPLETVVNLAVDHFNLSDGVIVANAKKQAFDLRGNNLRAELQFNRLRQSYSGVLGLDPIYVVDGKNTPVQIRLQLPVILEKDRVELKNATITTPTSALSVNGTLENLRAPKIKAHLNGQVGLTDVRNVADLPIIIDGHSGPQLIDIDANVTGSGKAIDVTGLRVAVGQSSIEASGRLKDPQGRGNLAFTTSLAVGELGKLARMTTKPEGTLELNGVATVDAANNFDVTGNLQGKSLSFVHGASRVGNLNVKSAFQMDSHRIALQRLRLNALGGEFLGDISLEEFRFYQVDGTLRSLDIQTAARTLGDKQFPYTGVISGSLKAAGDLKGEGAKAINADANLSIAPGPRGIPVSGKLNANYSGATGSVRVENSFVALPHTRLTLNGSLNNQLNVSLNSRDLNDLLAVSSGPPPVVLNGGTATFNGTVRGAITDPVIAGRVDMNHFSVQGRAFETLSAELTAASTGASVRDASLRRGPMNADFTAKAGLRAWKPLPPEPLTADISVRGADLADMIALTGQAPGGFSGALTADAHIQGTIGNPQGSAMIEASGGQLYDEPFDRAEIHLVMADRMISLPSASITSGPRRIDLSAEFQHPPETLNSGQLHAHVRTNELDLASIHALQRTRPNSGGIVQLDADVRGSLSSGEDGSRFLLTAVTANASAKKLLADGQSYGDLTLSANTAGRAVNYTVTSDLAGSALRINGKTQLARDYPTTADASISRLPIERVLALAKKNIPARGNLSGTAHFNGTISDLRGGVDLDLSSAMLYDEPLDRVRLRMDYQPDSIDINQLEVDEGSARLSLNGRFEHPINDFTSGNLQFKVETTTVDLTKIRNAQKLRPGIGGTLEISISGTGALRAAEPRFQLGSLNADIEAAALVVERRPLGSISLKAGTAGVQRLRFSLDSNLAGSAIHGEGDVQTASGYPVDAHLTFNNVAWNRLRDVRGLPRGGVPTFDVVTDGAVSVTGPLMKTEQLSGSLQLTRLNFDTLPGAGVSPTMNIRNQGPVAVSLKDGTIQVESAHLTGSQTDLQITGTASLPQQTLNMNLNATANLALLQSLNRDIVSSGVVAASAAVRGTFFKPQINGQMELKNAAVNYAALPNGIENANGAIVFDRTTATIRTLTAETGGGKLTASGFVGYADGARVGLRARAAAVRSRLEQGVSVVCSADIRLTGTLASSTLSGNVTVEQLNYAPQSDIGAILSRSATPVKSDAAPSPLLDSMKLDIHVQTSPSLGVQASMAQNLQASADLHVRGTAAQPGVLGRVTISEGELVFFGSTYTVNSGTIAFYDPLRVTPVLNVSLETQAKGVDVILTVTGPIDNMKLSYTSDPPLQFQEIVGLLASGRTPTSDPTLLANQPSQPSQSFEQMGESALLGKALADPIASRMQRVFGVTQLKIDPAFTGGSQIPTARLTFQQQITSNVTFTYTSALDDPNSTIVRAEWSFNPQYSAVASRDQNGIVSVSLFYKKQFR